jgi:CDP-diglyceride synthetase
MAGSDLRTRAILAPTMLLVVGGVYWLDWSGAAGFKPGALSAAVLLLAGVGGAWEYAQLLKNAGFAVAKKTLVFWTLLLLGSAFPLGWHDIDREFYPLVIGTMALLFPLAVRSLGKNDMKAGLERQGATLLGFVFVAWPVYLAMGTCFRHLPSALYVVLVCKGGDIGGYCVGRVLGRHKLIPHIHKLFVALRDFHDFVIDRQFAAQFSRTALDQFHYAGITVLGVQHGADPFQGQLHIDAEVIQLGRAHVG